MPELDPRLVAFLAIDSPWPTVEVVRTLVDAAEHLLRDHDCDTHGHELIRRAMLEGRARLAALEAGPGTG